MIVNQQRNQIIIIIIIIIIVIVIVNNNNNNLISVRNFEDTCTIYSVSKLVEIFMDSDIKNATDTLFNTILNRIQQSMETSNERES